MQEALQQVCNATAHYSSARTFSQTEQPLLQAAVKNLVNVVAPLNAACFQRIYPEAAAQVAAQSATKGLQDVIQTWEREQVQQPGECRQVLQSDDISNCYQACPPRLVRVKQL